MRTFEIIDSLRKDKKPCAVLTCDQVRDSFRVELAEWAGPADVPLAFAPFAEAGQSQVPEKWASAWVAERIAPPSRQNIGQVLRAYGLDGYNACALLAHGEGRCAQDDFYLREVTPGYRESALLGGELRRARAQAGLSQEQLAQASGIKQETISRMEHGHGNPTAKTLDVLAHALGKELKIRFE